MNMMLREIAGRDLAARLSDLLAEVAPDDLVVLKPVLSAARIGELLGVTEATFRTNRAKLEKLGFPPPLPGMPRGWSRAAVLRWIETNGGRDELPAGRSEARPTRMERAYAGL